MPIFFALASSLSILYYLKDDSPIAASYAVLFGLFSIITAIEKATKEIKK